MSFDFFLLAGLFDGPWMFLILVLVSGIANWLAKRRAGQEGESPDEPPTTSTSGMPPVGWEERLKRLLGEEATPPPLPPRTGAPPLVPRPSPPVIAAQPPPPTRPAIGSRTKRSSQPVRDVGPWDSVKAGVNETIERYEKLRPADRLATPGGQRSRRAGWGASLRQPRAAREAFLSSLVFGPPKALED